MQTSSCLHQANIFSLLKTLTHWLKVGCKNKPVGKILELILDPTMNQFKFENIRVINDFYERYKLHRRQMNLVEFKSNWEFYLTDNREILYVNKSQNIIMFEEIEWQNDIYQKIR